MMPRLKSLVLTSFFAVCAMAAVATHVWRQRVEAEFDPRPLFGVIFAQDPACRPMTLEKPTTRHQGPLSSILRSFSMFLRFGAIRQC